MAENSSGSSFEDIDKAAQEKLQEFINIAFEESPEKAIEAARKYGNAHIFDELHDRLAELHDELVARNKLDDTK